MKRIEREVAETLIFAVLSLVGSFCLGALAYRALVLRIPGYARTGSRLTDGQLTTSGIVCVIFSLLLLVGSGCAFLQGRELLRERKQRPT